MAQPTSAGERWPQLPWHDWEPTITTVHHWLQIVGRVRMVLTPRQPHWGHVPLEVTPRGLTTGPIPFGARTFAIDIDFVGHRVEIIEVGALAFVMPLVPMSVARFYLDLMTGLDDLAIDVRIPTAPAENPTGTPLDRDEEHAAYDPDHALRMWQGFVTAARVLQAFRHAAEGSWTAPRLFWGSLDLATSRHEAEPIEHTAGWWPTSPTIGPAFYAYTKPEPDGFRTAPIAPPGASFDAGFGEFILTWDAALATVNPAAAVQAFLESTDTAGRLPRRD